MNIINNKIVYKRIILKISGDFLQKNYYLNVNNDLIKNLINEIKYIISLGVQIAIVIGAGNYFKGRNITLNNNIKPVLGDHIGMLFTIINGLILNDNINSKGINAIIMSSLPIPGICNEYNINKALNIIQSNKIIIFVGGTGCSVFTTDTAACLRGIELEAQAVLKITKVNGVYSKDPIKYSNAVLYKKLTYNDVLHKKLDVMDQTAIILARNVSMPIHILNINQSGSLYKILTGNIIGTIITN
ncbi:UMP kinase [Enterobacteriaceae endosymbiont of Neohaemonia nigricornis]|uniref:UMP kinase n=1 Tax=Enterobacteriaceae endosymbiont of Neohaemonia nigricornis TaxID=2675792 RepID=UPI001448A399|nr:UMP kinase [Enterobacteriaceae endosymbiont of Neohaemonia nigricornis]QJC30424.1 UMP kinase [Enterobacteriaceae endosymbiont of Neohaemonia nigricornis]